MISDVYRAQVSLLVRTLPFVAAEACFALKGGTAINLFIRDMPRLSVDIDLTYLPVEDRAASLAAIEAALLRIKASIEAGIAGTRVTTSRIRNENALTKLVVATPAAQIKIEVTPVLRGTVYPVAARSVTPRSKRPWVLRRSRSCHSRISMAASWLRRSIASTHATCSMCAIFCAMRGSTMRFAYAFAVYMIGHGRPMAEVLSARSKDIAQEFERGFAGMTDEAGDVGGTRSGASRTGRANRRRHVRTPHRRLLALGRAGRAGLAVSWTRRVWSALPAVQLATAKYPQLVS